MIRGSRATPTVYADYQASTPLAELVAENLNKYFREQMANPHAEDHIHGWRAAEQVERAKDAIASSVGFNTGNVLITSGATEANNLAIIGIARSSEGKRRRFLVSAVEHKSLLAAADGVRDLGCTWDVIPVDGWGRVRLDEFQGQLDDSVLVVSVGLVNSEIGTRQDLKRIAELAQEVGALVHTDAAQAPADQIVDFDELRVDAMSLSAHKIYGPQGVGALIIRGGAEERLKPLILGGGQQGGLRSGTVPVALCRAFADAMELTRGNDAENARSRVRRLRDRFVAGVLTLDGAALNGPPLAERHVGNCNIRFKGRNAKDLLNRMQPRLSASTGSACSSGIPEPSHVLMAIGLGVEDAEASIRFSFGRSTTAHEIELAVSIVADAVAASDNCTG